MYWFNNDKMRQCIELPCFSTLNAIASHNCRGTTPTHLFGNSEGYININLFFPASIGLLCINWPQPFVSMSLKSGSHLMQWIICHCLSDNLKDPFSVNSYLHLALHFSIASCPVFLLIFCWSVWLPQLSLLDVCSLMLYRLEQSTWGYHLLWHLNVYSMNVEI